MFIGDQRFIETFVLDFLNFYGLKGDKQKLFVQSDVPNYYIGVTVKPIYEQKEPVKPELKVVDISNSDEDSNNVSKSKSSEESIDLMPTTGKKAGNPSTTTNSRPPSGNSGVEGFKKPLTPDVNQTKILFLDDLKKNKQGGVEFNPFSMDKNQKIENIENKSGINKISEQKKLSTSSSNTITDKISKKINEISENNKSRPQSHERPGSNDKMMKSSHFKDKKNAWNFDDKPEIIEPKSNSFENKNNQNNSDSNGLFFVPKDKFNASEKSIDLFKNDNLNKNDSRFYNRSRMNEDTLKFDNLEDPDTTKKSYRL